MRKIEFVDGWKDVKKQPYKRCLKKIYYLSNVICNKSPTSVISFSCLLNFVRGKSFITTQIGF